MDPKYPVYLTIIVVVAATLFIFMPQRSEVTVSDVKAVSARVTATFTNSGHPIDIRYWVEYGGTNFRHCPGELSLGLNETKKASWDCPSLAGQTGTFTVIIGPMA